VTDVQHNPVPGASVTWSVPDQAPATVDEEGIVAVENATDAVRVTATSNGLEATAVLHVTNLTADTGQTTNVTTETTTQTVKDTEMITHTAGLAAAQEDSKVNLVPPEDDEATDPNDTSTSDAFEGANVTVGEDVSQIAISVEIQEGSLTVTPEEVDDPDLLQAVQTRSEGQRPGLFVTVTATENGEQLDSARLNDIVDRMDARFKIPATFFETRNLVPDEVILAEYTEGERTGTVDTRLLDPDPTDGVYRYEATFTEFSSFAAIAQSRTALDPSDGGGGGGGGAPGLAVGQNFQAEAGQTLTVTENRPDGFAPVEITFESPCEGCRLTLRSLDQVPETAPVLPSDAEPLRVFEADVLNATDADVSHTVDTVRFELVDLSTTVPAQRLVLLHAHEGAWRAETTRIVTTDQGPSVQAPVSGLSPFALVVDDDGPRIHDVQPVPGTTTSDPTPTVTASFADASAIDPATLEVRIDGTRVADDAPTLVANETGFAYTVPAERIGAGTHTVNVSIADEHGQTATRTWTLEIPETVSPCRPIGSLTPVEPTPGTTVDRAGATIAVEVIVGCPVETAQATIDTFDDQRSIPLQRTAIEANRATYTATLDKLPATSTLNVSVELVDTAGHTRETSWTAQIQEEQPTTAATEGEVSGLGPIEIAFSTLAGLGLLALVAAAIQTTWVGIKEG
jgi:hypothetical protein